MGRIKSLLVKRTAKNLLKEENKFTEDFEKNKVLLGNKLPSKSLKNKIAGYLSRIKRQEREKLANTDNTEKTE
jgi:ribosomal protein S17E